MRPPFISLDQAMHLASEAFLPHGCITSANPEDDSFGFTVMNGSGDELLCVSAIARASYSDPRRLALTLEQARAALAGKGCPLDPWHLPDLDDYRDRVPTGAGH